MVSDDFQKWMTGDDGRLNDVRSLKQLQFRLKFKTITIS